MHGHPQTRGIGIVDRDAARRVMHGHPQTRGIGIVDRERRLSLKQDTSNQQRDFTGRSQRKFTSDRRGRRAGNYIVTSALAEASTRELASQQAVHLFIGKPIG